MNITGATSVIAFFGSTYKETKMPALYNAAFEAVGVNAVYVAFAVDDLARAVDGIRHLGIKGIGVTIPYKESIIPHLDELDDQARRIGAVNVVINKDGKLIGGNTDGTGALRTLQEKTDVKGKIVVVVGAGGAGKAIVFALMDAKANVTLVNRNIEKAQAIATSAGCRAASMEELNEIIPTADIIINATSVGMIGGGKENESLIDPQLLKKDHVVMDLVTTPRETPLLQHAKEKGCTIVYGYRMLLFQAIEKFERFTGVAPPIDVMERVMEQVKG